MIEKNLSEFGNDVSIRVSGLDIGEVVLAGLRAMGYIDEELQKRFPHARICVEDGDRNKPGFVDKTIRLPSIHVWGKPKPFIGFKWETDTMFDLRKSK